jgi:hypothetical protein
MTNTVNGYYNALAGITVTEESLPYNALYGVNWPMLPGSSLFNVQNYDTCRLAISPVDSIKAIFINELSRWILAAEEASPIVLPVLEDTVICPLNYYLSLKRHDAILAHIALYPEPVYSGLEAPTLIGQSSARSITWFNNDLMLFEDEDVFRYAAEVHPLKTKYTQDGDDVTRILQYFPSSWVGVVIP